MTPKPMAFADDGAVTVDGPAGVRVVEPFQGRRCPACGMWETHHVCHAPGAMTTDDALTVVLSYLAQMYLPVDIKDAYRILKATERWDFAETGLGSALQPTPKGRFVKVGQ